MGELRVFTGNANRPLAEDICARLDVSLGEALVDRFRNGETRVKIDENVRGADTFIIQPTSTPSDHHIMELLIMIDALHRASADRITAVVPYYGYARQEKKMSGREPITAKLVANLMVTAGADRVVSVDLHAPAIQGFFDVPVDHLTAIPLLAAHLEHTGVEDVVVVSPDSGGVARANELRGRARVPELAIIAKYRPQPDIARVLEMVGDVRDKTAVIVDDIVATGGTLLEAAAILLDRGARRVRAYAVHPELAANALDLIGQSPLERVVVTNTIQVPPQAAEARIEVINIAGLLAEAILRIHEDRSVSALFPPVRTLSPA